MKRKRTCSRTVLHENTVLFTRFLGERHVFSSLNDAADFFASLPIAEQDALIDKHFISNPTVHITPDETLIKGLADAQHLEHVRVQSTRSKLLNRALKPNFTSLSPYEEEYKAMASFSREQNVRVPSTDFLQLVFRAQDVTYFMDRVPNFSWPFTKRESELRIRAAQTACEFLKKAPELDLTTYETTIAPFCRELARDPRNLNVFQVIAKSPAGAKIS